MIKTLTLTLIEKYFMYCKNCGNEIGSDTKFCGKCGQVKTTTNTQEKIIDENLTSKEETKGNNKLKGLGGWLILVLIGFIYMGYSYGALALSSIKSFTDGTVESVSEIQGYAGAIGFELVMSIILFLFLGYLIFLFLKKSIRFPKFFIIFSIVNIIFIALDTYIISSVLSYPTEEIKTIMQETAQEGYAQLGKSIVYAFIWIWYMKVSKRVKLTFVEK